MSAPPQPPPESDPPPAAPAEPTPFAGSFRLGRMLRTDVYVHWSWFVAAYFLIRDRPGGHSSTIWYVAEYLAGFGFVLLHEFGHVLACRSVGGAADRIVLWPLGGLAFVSPPLRPGAQLWTTAAGPLVNVALLPLTVGPLLAAGAAGWDAEWPDRYALLKHLAVYNAVMLVFNLLPVYPLDGGRVLHELLWFWLGRGRSLVVAAGLGVVFGSAGGLWALAERDWWLVAMAAFLVLGAAGGLSYARLLNRIAAAPRHDGLACPGCGAAPPVGAFWRCGRCNAAFDLFAPSEACPRGGAHASEVSCLVCRCRLTAADWVSPADLTEPPAGVN